MYKDYYHLQAEPFGAHPSAGVFFTSHTHKEAWYYLLFGIETEEPFLVLTGEYGMGKTLLCLRLIKYLREQEVTRVEYISTPSEGYGGIVRRMAHRLGIPVVPEDEDILQDMVYNRFRADTERSRFYLIIDDAHELDTGTLTKLKHLSTFNHDEFFPIIMIFVGHPSFLKDLKTPALSSLNQRIKRRYHLDRFDLVDTKNYIYFRLLNAGATGVPIFADDTIQKIFAYSKGIPRLINNICDTCLLIGASKQMISIPPFVVDEARKIVEGSLAAEPDTIRDGGKTDERGVESNFSEVLPSGEGEKQAVVYVSKPEEAGDEQSVFTPAQPSKSVKASGNKAKWAVALIVLVLIGALLFRLSRDSDWLSLIFPPSVGTEQKEVIFEPESMKQRGQTSVEIPTLKGEGDEKPSDKIPGPAGRSEVAPPVGETSPKSEITLGSQPVSKGEAVAPGARETMDHHPYSLRSSSYQQQELALKEIAEIRKQGLAPYLVKTDLGDLGSLWRIYIGFYRTEDEAQKAKAAYKLAHSVVQRTDYACQLGEFSQEADIISSFEKFRQSGYFPYVIQKERNLFRIYSGAYEKRAEAEAHQQELQRKGFNCQVVRR